MKRIIIMSIAISLSAIASAQQKTKTMSKEIVFEQPGTSNVLYLANINGHVKAEGYEGNKVLLEATRTIKAKTDARLEKALEELSIGIIDRVDTILVYIKSPCNRFGNKSPRYQKRKTGWGYNWDDYKDDCREQYDYTFDFALKIPKNLNVYLSTVNDGDISIKGLDAKLAAHNINGSIDLQNVTNEVYAYTINGDVTIDYDALPKSSDGDSYFYTLNGDINANYPKGLKAHVSFKSYNGDLFTNIDDIQYMPALVSEEKTKDKGVSFKVDTKSLITVRGGGVALDFETFNGDVYVKEN